MAIQNATLTQLRVLNASSSDIPKNSKNTVKLAGSFNKGLDKNFNVFIC